MISEDMIYVVNKKRKIEGINKEFPDAVILDITSHASRYARVLSPFYPHYNIPVPGMPNTVATCVEAVWQGLKVFESVGVDTAVFENDTMKNLKRSVRKYGVPLGHKYGDRLLSYFDARMKIYLPTYKYVLDNVPEVHRIVERIKEHAEDHDVVLLDYNTNIDVADTSKPLSHAGLVKLYIEGRYPKEEDGIMPMTKEEVDAKREMDKQAKKDRLKRAKKHKQAEEPLRAEQTFPGFDDF